MSEFSESYHLRGTARCEVIELLERADLAGFIFPALDGWVSFVASGEPFRPNTNLIRANEGVLLRWVYGEDHGWEFGLYKAKKLVCNYSCSWEEDIAVDGKVNHAQLEQELGYPLPALQGEAGLGVFYPQSLERLFEVKPAYAFASAIGLSNYRWLSYEYLERDSTNGHSLPAGVQALP